MEHMGGLLSVGASWSVAPVSDLLPDEKLRVTAIHDPPYLSIELQADGSYRYDGYLYKLWEIVANELNITYSIVPLLKGGYGIMDENGTWNGMVGELAHGRADIALTWLHLRQDRTAVVDYIDAVPVEYDQYTFYVRQGVIPQITPSMFSSLLKPLHVDVWWMLLVSLLVLSVVLRVSLRFNHRRAESRDTVEDMTWGSCLLSSFMSVVGQGWASTPDSLAARTVTISSWMMGILIYVNYTANLISYLTVVTVDKPISSLQEFSEQSGWTFAIESGIGTMNDWKVSRDPYERALFWRSVSRDGFMELNQTSQSMRRTIEPRMLTYTDASRLFYALGLESCDLVPMESKLPSKRGSFLALAKGRDQLRQAINLMMSDMQQAGIIARLKNHWLQLGQDRCPTPAGYKELSFGDLLAVLILVPLEIVSSAAILLAELAWFRMQPVC